MSHLSSKAQTVDPPLDASDATNYLLSEGLVINKPRAFYLCYCLSPRVYLLTSCLYSRSIVVLVRLEAARGYTKNYIYLEVNHNYLILSYPIGPLDINNLAK